MRFNQFTTIICEKCGRRITVGRFALKVQCYHCGQVQAGVEPVNTRAKGASR